MNAAKQNHHRIGIDSGLRSLGKYKWVNQPIFENDPENYFIDAIRYVSMFPSKIPCWGGLDHIDLSPKKPDHIYSVSGIKYDHNLNQELPEIIGEWFDLDKTEIIGYKAGDYTVKSPKLEWRHFLRVQKLNETRHPKTKVHRVTVIAWTKNNYKAPVLLICKLK